MIALSADSHEGETLKADYTRRSCCDAWADGGSIPPTSTIFDFDSLLPADSIPDNRRLVCNPWKFGKIRMPIELTGNRINVNLKILRDVIDSNKVLLESNICASFF